MSKELVVALPNGGTLRCGPGYEHDWGGYLRICDNRGRELLYWEVSEWQAEGEAESVIGAVFAAALKPLAELRKELQGDPRVGRATSRCP